MAETVTYIVEIRDVDGKEIHPGSVLGHTKDGTTGVVKQICRAGKPGPIASMEGDLEIVTCRGCARITNKYSEWRHIPYEQQSYDQRYKSWLYTPWDPEFSVDMKGENVTTEEAFCIDAVMSLLPDDAVDWDNGPWPDRFDDVMIILKTYLEEISK